VNVGANSLKFTTGTFGFGANDIAADTLTLINSGLASGTGALTATTQLNLSGSDDVGTNGAEL